MSLNLRLLRSLALLIATLLIAGVAFAQMESSAGRESAEMDEKVVKVLRTTNKAQVLRYVPRVYDFENCNPHEIVNYFTSALATEEGGAYTFLAPDGESGKILVICPEYQIPYFDKLAKNLDRKDITSAPGSKYIYYRLKHRSAGDIDLLNVLKNYGGELPVFPDPSAPNSGQAWQADFETNSVLLFDAPSGSENAQKALEEVLDVPTPQINLRVKLYELKLNNDGTMGLDYTDWKNGPGALLLSGEFGGERLTTMNEFYSDQWSYTGGYYLEYSSAYFDFLVEKNKANVVVENTLPAMTNSPAVFSSEEQYLYFSKQYPEQPFGPNELVGENIDNVPRWNREVDMSISPINVGVDLEILPKVGRENIDLVIDLEVDSVTGYADGEVGGQLVRDMPVVNTRSFSDRINVPINQEIVIGGMTRERVVKNAQKIPVLGSLPVIGWLFGGEDGRTEKTMVVAVIKPESVNDMKNYNQDAEMLVTKAEGDETIEAPEMSVGFDQWLLDSEK